MAGYFVAIFLLILIGAGIAHMINDWHKLNMQIACIEHHGKWDTRHEQCDFEGCK